MGLLDLTGGSLPLQIHLFRSEVSVMADTSARRTLAKAASGDDLVSPFVIVDSRLRGIYQSFSDCFNPGRVIAWTNNVLDRCTLNWSQSAAVQHVVRPRDQDRK